MIKWLKNLFKKIGESKFWKFLVEVFQGKTGEFLDENYEAINNSVKITEEIAEYILKSPRKTVQEIQIYVRKTYKVEISEEEIEEIDNDKSTGKFVLAYNLTIRLMKANGKEFVEKLFKSALSLGIELAVSRYFGKE